MSMILTIQIEEKVKLKLQTRAIRNNRSLEAEALDLLTQALSETNSTTMKNPEETHARPENFIGIWKDRGTTDKLMELTRG